MIDALPPDRLPSILPPNEAERLEALRRYYILDTPTEVAFDRITTLAARLFDMPIVLVSLLDDSRAWFKSSYGFDLCEVARDDSICNHSLLSKDILIVPDTRKDDRFACNPFVVAEAGIRFYAGAPLVTHDGHNLGTLCLIDSDPRETLSEAQKATLTDLAAMVVDELELRLAAKKIAQTDAALLTVTQGVSTVVGGAFFQALVQHFAKVLDVDYVYIGLLVDHKDEAIQTIAVCAQGQISENFSYLLKDTPCKAAMENRTICCYPRRVQAQFPDAPLLAPLNIESYIAIPFFDSTGSAIGLLSVMDCNPLENVHLAESLLAIFALRIATELERQQTEENRTQLLAREQQARAQAETANRMKDQFLAVLSHELRTPLNPILGWAKLLRSRSFDPAKTEKALETIERNALLQTQLIDDLLDISRIVQGKLSLTIADIDLTVTIRSAIDTLQLAAQAKTIAVEFESPSLSVWVSGDTNRLQQVIWNLLSNAIKFTPAGGQIVVDLETTSGQAQVQVSDTGKGIVPEFLPFVFESFRQADSATTRQFGGLGLGLAIVRQLVESHGGTVKADSLGEGQGATFTLKLPLLNGSQPKETNVI
ncbi:MAG: GAF domain-containing sensor histidine kinase [Phormidesmis sp. CAN_BIN36]|nr:GAF domain-containing sensor histidine kinase [Phormidesmis sp. CAN_BIN36]